MKQSTAFFVALLSALPVDVVAQCPENEELNECEMALFETVTYLDGKSKEGDVRLQLCKDKLRIRTSTVIREIVQPCPERDMSGHWQLVLTSGAVGLLLGIIAGLFAR